MTQALLQALPDFVPAFARGLSTNLSIAAHALAVGLPAGLMLCALRLPAAQPGAEAPARRHAARAAGITVALLRAAPTFVVMYVLLDALPARWAVSPAGTVALALSVYAAAYVADNAAAAVCDWRAGSRASVLLFLMGLVRAYFVMVLSSGLGAAIGVTEATAVTLRALEQLPSPSDRLWLMGGVVLVFIALRQGVYIAIAAAHRRLQGHRAG